MRYRSPRFASSHRFHGRPGAIHALVAFAAGLAITLTLAGCGLGSSGAPRTVTKVVTAGPTTPTGTGITVVAPGDLGTGTAGSNPQGAAGTTGPVTDASSTAGATSDGSGSTTGESSTTATTTSSTTSLPPIPTSVQTVLNSGCPILLTATDIRAALGKALSDKQLRVVDVPNPGVGMTGRTRCYYGTDDLTVAKPLAVALAAYATAEAAQAQLSVTVNTETGLGARAVTPKVAGHPTTVLLRDGGLLVMQQGTWTLSIALANGVIPAGQLSPALQKLAIAVLKHVG